MVTISPSDRKSGTLTTAPVERIAGLLPPAAVSPFTPGSVCSILKSTKIGGITDKGDPFQRQTYKHLLQ